MNKFMTLKDVADFIGGEAKVTVEPSLKISGVASLHSAKAGDISYASGKKHESEAEKSCASALVIDDENIRTTKPCVIVKNARLAFAKIIPLFSPAPLPEEGVHPSAVLCENVSLGKKLSIGAHSFIGKNSRIGNHVKIFPQVYIGENVTVGEHTVIYPRVTVLYNVTIGSRGIIHSGTVIGADGFGFETEMNEHGFVRHCKIPQVGSIIIENDVEIGANCCVDRGMLDATIIKKGTKIDNLAHIGHNVTVGEHTIIVAQAGIAGSAVIGNRVIIGGQAGVRDHVSIGDGAIVIGQAGVTKNVKEKAIVSDYPARDHNEQRKLNALLRQLPRIIEKLKEKKIL